MKNLKTYALGLMATFGSVAFVQSQSNDNGTLLAVNGARTEVVTDSSSAKKKSAGHQTYLYSKTGKGIGIHMVAGNEFDGFSDEKIQSMFDGSMKSQGVIVKVFIDRTDNRNSSLYKCFVDGEGIGVTATMKDFSGYLKEAIKTYKSNRGIAGFSPNP